MTRLPDKMTLRELAHMRRISNGVMNICRRHDLTTLGSLRAWLRRRPFSDLGGCGKQKELELNDLVQWADGPDGEGYEIPASGIGDAIMSVDSTSRLHELVLDRFTRLSVRARNCASTFMSSMDPAAVIRELIVAPPDLLKVRNLGAKTLRELQEFRLDVLRCMEELAGRTNSEADEGNELKQVRIWPAVRGVVGEGGRDRFMAADIVDQQGRTRALKILAMVLDDWAAGGTSTWSFIRHYMSWSSASNLVITAERMGLTRERVRQIKEDWERRFWQRVNFMHKLPGPFAEEELIPAAPVMIVDDGLVDRVNKAAGEQWSARGAACALAALDPSGSRFCSWVELGVKPRKLAFALDDTHPVMVRNDLWAPLIRLMKTMAPRLSGFRTQDLTIDVAEIPIGRNVAVTPELLTGACLLAGVIVPGAIVEDGMLKLPSSPARVRPGGSRKEGDAAPARQEGAPPPALGFLRERNFTCEACGVRLGGSLEETFQLELVLQDGQYRCLCLACAWHSGHSDRLPAEGGDRDRVLAMIEAHREGQRKASPFGGRRFTDWLDSTG